MAKKKSRSAQGRASKEKGKLGEREVAAILRDRGFQARRGQQFAGGGDSPDVVHTVPGLHIEVKRTETLSLYTAMGQAEEDAPTDQIPVVVHRRSNKPWLLVMKLDDFLDYCFEKP